MAAVAAVSAARARAAGTLVEVAPEQFVAIANRLRGRDTMVVHGRLGLRARTHVYVTDVHGPIFYCLACDSYHVRGTLAISVAFSS